ncbi:MAG: DUF1854 domain-containing protein [Clostridia bacterium]|nr:DUF1854 domain-containing protein [Clostridia bacterium]
MAQQVIEKEEKKKVADEAKEAKNEKKEAASADEIEKLKKEAEEAKKALDEVGQSPDEIEAMFNKRESVSLTPDNCRFYRSEGGLISMELTLPDKDPEQFERIVVLRSFPISNPDEYISIREPATRRRGNGSEIGLIRSIHDFDEATVQLLGEELDRRYFTPELLKIYSLKEKFGYLYCEAETSAGRITFVLNNPYSNFRTLEDHRVLISDIDGNAFMIKNPENFDKASLKKIEIYL